MTKADTNDRRKLYQAAFFLIFSLILFYPSLFLAKSAPLTGDHFEQHYPWALLLGQYLKHGHLPFWTPMLQCGFPIAAESQIGIFYLPNIVLLGLLPFRIAYSWMNLIHFFIAGWGTYLYAMRVKLPHGAALISACLFLYGGAYGGAYYNMTSLKTVAWFPIVLWLFEVLHQEQKKWPIVAMALSIGMSLVAGYLQVALFTWLIFGIYAAGRVLLFRHAGENQLFTFIALLIVLAGAVLIASPQIYLTYFLSLDSTRQGLSEDYAYVGSMSPFVWLSLFNPVTQYIFRGNNLYHGLISLFFLIAATRIPNKDLQQTARIWKAMLIIILLLALGRWSPLYIGLVKLTHVYSFRVPAKFIVFICFGIAMLAGIGFETLNQSLLKKENLAWVGKIYFRLATVYTVLAALFWTLLKYSGPLMQTAGEWYVRHFIFGKAGHPRTLSSYLDQIPAQVSYYLNLYDASRWDNIYTLCALLLSLLFALLLIRKQASRKWLIASLIFLTVDLYAYSWIDIKQDFADYAKLPKAPAKIIQIMHSQKGGRLLGYRTMHEGLPVVPSINMVYGIPDIGIYTPLVMKRYYETIGQFGNVNDSTAAAFPSEEFIYQRLPLLSAFGVSHILTKHRLSHSQLKVAFEDPKIPLFLYENLDPHHAVYFVHAWKRFQSWEDLKSTLMSPGFDPRKELLLEQNEWHAPDMKPVETAPNQSDALQLVHLSDIRSVWSVTIQRPGFFVLNNTMSPGWEASVNGAPVKIFRAYGLFQAIYFAQPGTYKIELKYHPFRQHSSV